METRNVKISLETATRWYNGTDNELKELVVQTYPEIAKKELPKSWEDLKEIEGYYTGANCCIGFAGCNTYKENKNTFATKEQAEASIALAQLSQLIKVYNDGWEPDWTDDEFKFCIYFIRNSITSQSLQNIKVFLSFKDAEIRDLFLENFRELIETAKPLLS
jgi:hypothetical protein